MKLLNIISIAFSATILSTLIGCSEEISERAYKPSLESNYLNVYPRDFEFGNSEETKTGTITSENAWSFTTVPSWLSLTPSSGNSDADFSLTSAANESLSNRQAIFYISTNKTSSNIQRALTASQVGSSPYITFPGYDSSTITIEGKNDCLNIEVNSNIPDLEAAFSQSWGKAFYNSETNTLNVEIQANETNSSRNGVITVSSKRYNRTSKLTISQLASGVKILDGIAMDFDADGGSQTRTISSDLPWTAQTTYSWIDFSPKSGNAGETTMTISTLPSYESDKRIGQIYFYFGDTEKEYIGITQTGRYLIIDPKEISLSADDNSSEIVHINSNIDWKVATCPEWLTLSQNTGTAGSTDITITATKNNSLNSRSATLTITDSPTGTNETNLLVIQNGYDFEDRSNIEFCWQNSTQSISIPFPNRWNAAVSDGWITLSQYTGIGATTCEVTVSRNDATDTRTGEIIITSEGQSMTVYVVQQGQYITIDATSGEVSAMENVIELYVNTTMDVIPLLEYYSDVTDWISYEIVSENLYLISVKYNPSINQRSASFVLKPKDNNVKEDLISGIKYQIIQFGRNLCVEPPNINMFAKGGTSDIYSIIADGSYSIIKPEEYTWFTLVYDSSNNSYYVVATENKTDQPRFGEIIVSLTNLPQGEVKHVIVPVHQFADGDINIIIDDFNDPIVW